MRDLKQQSGKYAMSNMSIENLPFTTISVLLPIYKEPVEYIRQSIDSILNQTFQDFRLILLVDTGFKSPEFNIIHKEVLEYYKNESKILMIVNSKNLGLVSNLNNGLRLANSKYIARMDADDIAFKERFEKQLEFMEKNYDISLCGCRVNYINSKGEIIGQSRVIDDKELVIRMLCGINPVCHSTFFARKEVYTDLNGYREVTSAEDYDFLARMMLRKYKVHVMDKVLMNYRVAYRESKISAQKRYIQLMITKKIAINLRKGREIGMDEVNAILNLRQNYIFSVFDSLSLKLDDIVQRKYRSLYGKLKWPIFLISPSFFLTIIGKVLCYLRYKILYKENFVKFN